MGLRESGEGRELLKDFLANSYTIVSRLSFIRNIISFGILGDEKVGFI